MIFFIVFTVLIFTIAGVGTPLFFHLDGRLPPDVLLAVAFSVNDIYCFGFIIQFSSAAIAVRDRFAILQETFLDQKILNVKEVYGFIELHEKLFKCIKMINNHLTVQIIPSFGYLASSATFSAYNLVRSFLKDVSMKSILTVSNGTWLALEGYVLIIGISSGSSSSSEAESFHDTGYEILRDRKILNCQCKEDFKEFLESKRRSNFHLVSAFFDIDWRLLLSVSIIEFA